MSMELSTVLELVKAGFSKDEIMQMAQPQSTDTNIEPVQLEMEIPTQSAEPEQKPATEPVATPAPVEVQEEAQPSMADIMQSIAKLTSAVQANAIAQSVIPQEMQNAPTAEDMLAEVIRPTYKERS